MKYSRSQLVVHAGKSDTRDSVWAYSQYNIGDLVEYEGNVYRVQAFSVLKAEPYINYDIGVGRDIPEDELEAH